MVSSSRRLLHHHRRPQTATTTKPVNKESRVEDVVEAVVVEDKIREAVVGEDVELWLRVRANTKEAMARHCHQIRQPARMPKRS